MGKGQCWITTGLGAEGIVTDATSGAICRDSIIPHLRERDYGAAVLAGVGAISERLHRDAGLTSKSVAASEGSGDGGGKKSAILYVLGSILTAIAALVSGSLWRRHRPRTCRKCGKKMHRLAEKRDDASLRAGQQLEEKLGSVDYDVWQCAGCGEETVIPYIARFKAISECPKCQVRVVKTKRRTLQAPTYTSTGLAEDTKKCEACGDKRVATIVLAKRTSSSSSSGSGGGGGSSSSFGGSGSSSGGGGGSSY